MKKNNEQTFYEILRVSPTATIEEIKIAYRRRAMEYHPDINPGTNNKACYEMMCKINEAYRVLRDTELRRLYDQMLQEKGALPEEENHFASNTQTSNNPQTRHNKTYCSQETYEYYNSVDFDVNSQEEFIDWINKFSKRYIKLVFDYYKKLNIDGNEITYKLYKEFETIIENEIKLSKRNFKTNNL